MKKKSKLIYNPFQEGVRIEKSVIYTAENDKAREIAKNLKNAGVSSQIISQTTGLSEEEINKL